MCCAVYWPTQEAHIQPAVWIHTGLAVLQPLPYTAGYINLTHQQTSPLTTDQSVQHCCKDTAMCVFSSAWSANWRHRLYLAVLPFCTVM
jgi:hypothetical protein